MEEDDDDNEMPDGDEFFEMVKDKLRNPEILEKIYNAKFAIEDALQCQVIISVPDIGAEHAEEVFNSVNNSGIDKKTNTMKLGYLVDCLSREPRELNIYMDTLHFDKGVNPLQDILIVPMDGYILLVPKNKVK